MNFKNYQEIINHAKNQIRSKKDGKYYEDHHILPIFMGGEKNSEKVLLTIFEHALAHYLLSKECDKRYIIGNICSAGLCLTRKNASIEEIEEILNNPKQLKIIEEIKSAQKGKSKDRYWITDGVNNKYLSVNKDIPYGWLPGRTQNGHKWTEEQKLNGRCKNIGKGIYINKDNQVKRIQESELTEYISQGWIKGSIDRRKNIGGPHKNRTKTEWIHKDDKQQMCSLEELDNYLNKGWQQGRLSMSTEQRNKLKGKREYYWITDGTHSQMISLTDPIPIGYYKGRVCKY